MNVRSLTDIFGRVRTEVPMETADKTTFEYGIPLPMHGKREGRYKITNSGGRGALPESGEDTYLLKGADPFNVITETVANFPGNLIVDVNLIYQCLRRDELMGFVEREGRTIIGNISDCHEDPLGVMREEQAWTSFTANEHIGDFYQQHGFYPPRTPLAIFKYDKVGGGIYYLDGTGKERDTYCMLFKIPSKASDLRSVEYSLALCAGLAEAGPEGAKACKENSIGLHMDMISWYGFCMRALYENELLPDPSSMVHQNFVISQVSDEGFGLGIVDHGSTAHQPPDMGRDEIKQILTSHEYKMLFNYFPTTLLLAISLSDRGLPLESTPYKSYIECAMRERDKHMRRPNSAIIECNNMALEAFDRGFEGNVTPIDEKRFTEGLPFLFGKDVYSALGTAIPGQVHVQG